MALFINPCQYSTYVNPPPRKSPSREKAYFQTNLTLGGIEKIGKMRSTGIVGHPVLAPPHGYGVAYGCLG